MITYTVDLCCDGPNCAAMISCGPEAMVAKAIIGAERLAKSLGMEETERPMAVRAVPAGATQEAGGQTQVPALRVHGTLRSLLP